MNHADSGITKIQFARYISACLGYLANMQSDAVGLNVFREGDLFMLKSGNSPQHITRFIHQLEMIQPAGKFTEQINYKHLFTGGNKREMLVFITDFYEKNGEIMQLLETLSSLRHEIIVFHLMGSNELNLDYKGISTLEDLETGETIHLNSSQIKKMYQEKLQAHLASLRSKLLDKHIFYKLVNIGQPIEQTLRDFLNQRQKSNF
jgi:uncharacterized protein (DUF58 family)